MSRCQVKHRSVDADTKRIMKAISALLPAEAREHTSPRVEELPATYPGGAVPDDVDRAQHESDRRPGTD